MKQLAFLRGINVGGKNKLPMKDLADMFINAGCKDVRTFIQSGNVIFDAPSKLVRTLPELVGARIKDQFGYQIPVVLRTAEELQEALAGNPFLKNGADENTLHLMFLADAPPSPLIQQLDPDRSPPDRFVVRGKDIYLHLPKGVADTKLTNAYFDSKLKTVSTGRNWRTVTKLVELAGGFRK